MKDTLISAAPDILEISGKKFNASPFTDRQLDHLTNYVRYVIGRRAKDEAAFASTETEKAEILQQAFELASGIVWYEPAALSILSAAEGTSLIAKLMLQKEHPDLNKEWLDLQFGSTGTVTEETITNVVAIRAMFQSLNSLDSKVSDSGEVSESKKKSEVSES